MTFSILGHCERSGMLGLAMASSSLCVGSDCPWVRSGVGAVVVQYMADPTLGVEILDAMGGGAGAASAVQGGLDGQPHADYRQVAAIDCRGTTGHFTGTQVEDVSATFEGKACVAIGNVLAARSVPKAMIDSFASTAKAHLAERLVRALQAGVDAGGEKDPLHSAVLLIVRDLAWPLVNLRVDWCEDRPVEALTDLWSRYEPEVEASVTWALNPSEA